MKATLFFVTAVAVCLGVNPYATTHQSVLNTAPIQVEQIESCGFENDSKGEVPDGWKTKGGPGFSAFVVDEHARSGEHCLQLVSKVGGDAPASAPSGSLGKKMVADQCQGKRIRFKAMIKADFDDEQGQAIMWLREDLNSGETGAFDNMMDRPIKSGDWKEHEIVVDISEDAKSIALGFLVFGNGKVHVDDVVIEEVEESVAVTAGEKKGGISATPGLFEIVGSMKVKANLGLIKRKKRADEATLLMPLPLRYGSQYPVTFNLSANPPEALKSFKVFEIKPGNFVAEATLQEFAKHREVDVAFNAAVLVLPTDFSNVPATAKLPDSMSKDAMPWLESTWCVKSKDRRIASIAKEIRSETDDILEIIAKVEEKAQRIFNSAEGGVENLTAVEALDKRGSCTSCGNLVAAILRATGVPARVLAGYPSWSGPLQTHYIVEAYIPNYGWYPIESTMCRSPWPNQNQINVSIVPPEYESRKLAGWRTGVAGGVPYLSLTEIRDNDGFFFTTGTIPEHEYCDHACEQLKKFKVDQAEWQNAAAWSEERWKSWLESNPEIVEGKIQFGPDATEIKAESPNALINEIKLDSE